MEKRKTTSKSVTKRGKSVSKSEKKSATKPKKETPVRTHSIISL